MGQVVHILEAQPITRRGLSGLMHRICDALGANSYLLAEIEFDRGRETLHILTSNWIYDAVEGIGHDGIRGIAAGCNMRAIGAEPRPFRPEDCDSLDGEQIAVLIGHGHRQIYCHRIAAAGRRVVLLLTLDGRSVLREEALPAALMEVAYAFSEMYAASACQDTPDLLSERERECLRWGSEGKTADEIALILGVSANTVNSYVAHAIKKCGASNRAMAIATAIRTGSI